MGVHELLSYSDCRGGVGIPVWILKRTSCYYEHCARTSLWGRPK